MPRIEHNGITFEFSRNTGVGEWYPITRFGRTPAFCAVSVDFGQELTEKAIAAGVEEPNNFSRHIIRKRRVKAPRSERIKASRKKNSSRKKSGRKAKNKFNPLAALFN